MSFCPQCRDEFESWAEVCPDCKVPLVEQLSALPGRSGDDEPLVKIATAPNEPIARMWAGALEENGIRCMLKGGNLGAAMYIPTITLAYQIYVLESETDKAKEILAPFLETEA